MKKITKTKKEADKIILFSTIIFMMLVSCNGKNNRMYFIDSIYDRWEFDEIHLKYINEEDDLFKYYKKYFNLIKQLERDIYIASEGVNNSLDDEKYFLISPISMEKLKKIIEDKYMLDALAIADSLKKHNQSYIAEHLYKNIYYDFGKYGLLKHKEDIYDVIIYLERQEILIRSYMAYELIDKKGLTPVDSVEY